MSPCFSMARRFGLQMSMHPEEYLPAVTIKSSTWKIGRWFKSMSQTYMGLTTTHVANSDHYLGSILRRSHSILSQSTRKSRFSTWTRTTFIHLFTQHRLLHMVSELSSSCKQITAISCTSLMGTRLITERPGLSGASWIWSQTSSKL